MNATPDEIMTVALAGLIPDGAAVQVGAGVPLCLAAAVLAKATHAPSATLLPFGISGLESRSAFMLSLRGLEAAAYASVFPHDPMAILSRTEREGAVEPLAPAQVDTHGNINTVALGGYPKPRIRLPGVAGVDLLGTMNAPMILYTTRHSPRVLVDKVDLVMASGRDAEAKSGSLARRGPAVLLTNLAEFRWHAEAGWIAASLHPGVGWEQVRAATGFPLPERGPDTVTPEPTQAQLRLLREEIDPFGIRKLEFLSARARREELRRIMEKEREWLGRRGAHPC